MIKFVQKWIREIGDKKTIDEDKSKERWINCEEGLPHTDRNVQVLIVTKYGITKIDIGKFNPHIGWILENSGVVGMWRDMDDDLCNFMQDMDVLKKLTGIK